MDVKTLSTIIGHTSSSTTLNVYTHITGDMQKSAAMKIDTRAIVSATEANQNFSRVSRIAEKNGQAVIFKNNRPKYMLIDLDSSPIIEMTEDEKIDFVAARILKKYKPAFLELAK